MNIIKNALAVIVGLLIGGALNMAIVVVGPSIIPPPPGVDTSSMESIRASIHLYEAKHFITPFLAHALGTLVGALVAFVIATSHRNIISYSIGIAFFAGGIAASVMIPAPFWFITLDLVVAYLPMAWIAIQLGQVFRDKVSA